MYIANILYNIVYVDTCTMSMYVYYQTILYMYIPKAKCMYITYGKKTNGKPRRAGRLVIQVT